MKTTLSVLLAAAVFAAPALAAERTSLSDAKVGSGKAELLSQISHSSDVVEFFTTGPHKWMRQPKRSSCWTLSSTRARRICDIARRQLAAHRWLHAVATERYHRLYEPKPAPVNNVAGWLCVHSGEADWGAQTGNKYYGGLQMTYGWMGLVSNAALLSPSQQMAAAETGYRLSGYSDAWMRQQWPNTYPPCAGLFGQ